MKDIKLTNWTIGYKGQQIKARVPGDITIDLFKAGLVSDPYVAENYKDSKWVGQTDFTYTCIINVDEDILANESIELKFKGIDLFSSIYLNGKKLGDTKNAFLQYVYQVKDLLKLGENKLEVKMESTLNRMDQIDTTGYFAIFNIPRIFLRKPQCHFGWDWAPKICAYGIIDDVILSCKNRHQIDDVKVVADMDGKVRFHVEVNYDNKNLVGPEGEILKECEKPDNDKLVFFMSKKPFDKCEKVAEIPLMGNKNFYATHIYDCDLWWPNGYGKQPLYNYEIQLWRGGKLKDKKVGRYGFRSVELKEQSKDDDGNNLIGMDFYINGIKIFLKGSNWVPPECFTGVMEDDKYRKLIKYAKDMNANILRVWGGGAYEKDIFFDLCDEMGILTWQDIALACADIPEDNKEFLDNLLEEVTYQVKRLRNHPSLIYWCGGNEKTGTYGNCITHGDFLVNCTLYGLVEHLDGTRPYRRQSPHSYTDIGNDSSSGDSHHGNFELALNTGMSEYRNNIARKIVPFTSECAVLGPSSVESLKKIFPKDHYWPMDEMWNDRFMENPYAAILMDFPHRELYYAEQLYGKVDGLEDFVPKAMAAQGECLRAEAEYSIAHQEMTGAFLNWMFDDIWPSGTWSIVDYYLEPKEAYYQLRRAFAPITGGFYQDKDGKTHVYIASQQELPYETPVYYAVKKFDGTVLYEKEGEVFLLTGKTFDKVIDYPVDGSVYLNLVYQIFLDDRVILYSPDFYANKTFENKFTYEFDKVNDYEYNLTLKADSFVRDLFIHFKDNYKYEYSDNYLNLEKGQEVVIKIKSEKIIDPEKVLFTTL